MAPSDLQDLTGYLAAALTTTSFVPQVLHTWRTRSVHDVSLGMYLAFTSGVGLWLIYGLMVDSWPVIVANALTFMLALAILGMKLRFGLGGKR